MPAPRTTTRDMPRLILASASPRRLELLRQIGIEPDTVMPAEVDERVRQGEKPGEMAERLADLLGVPAVDLDALNWLPGWVALTETDPEEFETRLEAAIAGEGWVVAGDYSGFTRRMLWPRLHTVIWLDLPLPLILWRVITRSWRRWRSA